MNYAYLETPIGTLLIAGDADAVLQITFPSRGKAAKAEAGWVESNGDRWVRRCGNCANISRGRVRVSIYHWRRGARNFSDLSGGSCRRFLMERRFPTVSLHGA